MRNAYFPVAVLAIIIGGIWWGNGAALAGSEKVVKGSGSISGVVQSMDGGSIQGRVELTSNGEFVTEVWIGQEYSSPNGEFTIEDVSPGQYNVQFFDIGEIPLCVPQPVSVASGQNSEVSILIPMSISGMPCAAKLAMGYDAYWGVSNWAFSTYGGWGLSEVGQDTLAGLYGDCKKEDNDTRADALSRDNRNTVNDLRDALAAFENDYYGVAFFGGTASAHFPARAYATREDMLGEVISYFEYPYDPDPSEVESVAPTFEKVGGIADQLEAESASYYSDETMAGFEDAVQSLRDSADELQRVAGDLDGMVHVILGRYLNKYIFY